MFATAAFASAAFASGGDAADTGDPFRAACRSRLATHMADAGVTWELVDLLNTGENPDASASFIDIEFPGGSEDQYTFGAPGENFHDERGQITVLFKTRGGVGSSDRNMAEAYAALIRSRFRGDRFAADTTTVRIIAVAPMGGGFDEAGMWVESVALRYQRYNVG